MVEERCASESATCQTPPASIIRNHQEFEPLCREGTHGKGRSNLGNVETQKYVSLHGPVTAAARRSWSSSGCDEGTKLHAD